MAPKKIKVKPGKTESKIGFIVGIVFVLIGCFVAIPQAGLFGVFWTAMAGLITYTNYKNAFTDEGMASHEIILEDGGDVTSYSESGEDIEAKLVKLSSLYEQRLITKEEYDEKRKELLDKF